MPRPDRRDAEEAFDTFLELYKTRYPKACDCLSRDREVMMTFYDFPAGQWAKEEAA